MIEIPLEMTQGDPFYSQLAFVDVYGTPVDLTGWTVQVDFKLRFSDDAALFSLAASNGGLQTVATGILGLSFDADALSDVDINPTPRNGSLVPSRIIYGDVKLTPPPTIQLAQGAGSRTVILLRVYAGVTA